MNKKEVLSQANLLVSNGLRKAAIDLLREYISFDPNCPTVLSTLGRAYRLDKQTDRAIHYLKKSLEVKNLAKQAENKQSSYHADDFDDADLAFVETQHEQSLEDEFNLTGDTTQVRTGHQRTSIETKEPLPSQIEKQSTNTLQTDILPPKYEDEKKSESTANTLIDDDLALEPQQEDPASPGPTTTNTHIDYIEDEEPFSLDADPIESSGQLPFHFDGDDPQLPPINDFLDEEESVSDIEQIDDDDVETLFPLSLDDDEKTEELEWRDFEDLEEFDETAQRKSQEEVQDGGKLSREQRALQVATEVLVQTDWDQSYLSSLQQTFIENGWSAARTAIEREISKGMLAEEFELARNIKKLWTYHDHYWMSFYRLDPHSSLQQSWPYHQFVSWPQALKIIRSFEAIPDFEEIYQFIEDSFNIWYDSDGFRTQFPSFLYFLLYRTDSTSYERSGELFKFSLNPAMHDVFRDSDELIDQYSPEYQELLSLGLLPKEGSW